MEYFFTFFDALIDLSHAMSFYILFGLLFAGIMHELIPDSIVTKHLGNQNIASVIKSTLFGVPLPVCSCGVIPLASSIKKSGASKGATLSFLISTPITGVDSILATYGMFGWVFTIYRVITSMLIAIAAGVITNLLDNNTTPVKFSLNSQQPSFNTNMIFTSNTMQQKQPTQQVKKSFCFRDALRYGFITLLKDIAKPLFYGLIIGAVITTAIPQNLSAILLQNTWISYAVAIIIAVPMYVCATASLPIAAGLIIAGVSPGAAFVFLSAGPATNTVTIGVVKSMLGTTSLYTYLSSIIIGSILFGIGLDYIFEINQIQSTSLVHMPEDPGLLEFFSSVFLWGLVLFFLISPLRKR